MEKKDVFISYKAEEIADADWVRERLEQSGISCWMAPKSISGGSSYAAEIPQAINADKIIMPFMLEDCALRDNFGFYLNNVQRYAAYQDREAEMERMTQEILTSLGQTAAKPDTKEAEKSKEPKKQKKIKQQKRSDSAKRKSR